MQPLIDILQQTEDRYNKRAKQREENLERINEGGGAAVADTPERIENRMQRLSMDPLMAQVMQERVLGENNLMNINYLKIGLEVAKTVGRVNIRKASGSPGGFGTGFLVSPSLLLTNNHVLRDKNSAKNSMIEFNHEYDKHGKLLDSVYFSFEPDKLFITDKHLDYTLVAVSSLSHEDETRLSTFGWNRLIEELGKLVLGEEINIIQHPNGMPKQIAFRDNQMIDMDEDFMTYKTDTAPGSSGSLVCNDQWEVVGLHHSGVPEKNDGKIKLTTGGVWRGSFDNHLIKWIANEGVRISRIVKNIKEQVKAMDEGAKKLVEEMQSLKSPIDKYKEQIKKEVPKTDPTPVNNLLQSSGASLSIPLTVTVGLGDSGSLHSLTTTATLTQKSDQQNAGLGKNTRTRFELDCSENPEARRQAISIIEETYGEMAEPVFPDLSNESENNELKQLFEVFIASNENPWDLARKLQAIDGIDSAEPDLESKGLTERDEGEEHLESSDKGSNRDKIENEFPGISRNWNHKLTNFDKAVQFSKDEGRLVDSTYIKVAQIDTGYTHHPEIKKMNKKAGYDYKGNDTTAFDDTGGGFAQQGHGTRTGSIMIGGKTNLEFDQNSGVFPYVDFVPFRVADSVIILGTHRNVSRAVLNAVNNGFDVITMSMGSVGVRSWKKLAKYAYEKGVFWVCAAGNEVKFVVRPAAYPGTIAVAAVDYKKIPWKGSSRGRKVDIAAPGHNIYVPIFDNGKPDYSYGSGTSYATPHIASAAALWMNHHRKTIKQKYRQKWQQVEAFRTVVQQTSSKPSGWNARKYGDGILDALALLKAKLPDTSSLNHAYGHSARESASDDNLSLSEKEVLYLSHNIGLDETDLTKKIIDQSSHTTQEFIESLTIGDSTNESESVDGSEGSLLDFIEERF